jgi:hypothetical protein
VLDLRNRTAHHEAGHAVLSAAINDRPERVSIRGQDGTLGRSAQKTFVRPTSLAQVYLAGFAAEHLLTRRRPRCLDIEVGLGVLAHLDRDIVEKIEGVDATDGHGAVHQVLRTGVRVVEDEIRAEVERLYEITRESLRAVWPAVKAVAQVLLAVEELDRDGFDAAIGDADIFTPVFAVQRAHGLMPTIPSPVVAEGPLVEAAATKPAATETTRSKRSTRTKVDAQDRRVAGLLGALRQDPKLAPIVADFEKDAAKPGRKFGKNGLKTKAGKLFALFTQGTLVVKLPNKRVAVLVEEGVGEPFDPGHGRLMKEWLTVTTPRAYWVALAKEAFEFVGGARRT